MTKHFLTVHLSNQKIMYQITKRIGGLTMFMFGDEKDGYFFASLPGKQPTQFASKKKQLIK